MLELESCELTPDSTPLTYSIDASALGWDAGMGSYTPRLDNCGGAGLWVQLPLLRDGVPRAAFFRMHTVHAVDGIIEKWEFRLPNPYRTPEEQGTAAILNVFNE